MAVLLALLLALQGNIHEALYKHSKKVKEIQGVLDLSVGGVDGDLRIVVRVDSDETKRAVIALHGETLDGFKLLFIVSAPKVAAPAKPAPGSTVAAPPEKKDEPVKEPSEEAKIADDCDILRAMLKLPARKEGKSGRCQWIRRTVIGGATVAAPVTLETGG
jgi:hypothetical protein